MDWSSSFVVITALAVITSSPANFTKSNSGDVYLFFTIILLSVI